MTSPSTPGPGPDIYSYLPYDNRPILHWPNQARVALWVAPNIEFYEMNPPPTNGVAAWPKMDARGIAWRDYGNRVGVWRFMDVLAKHGVRASVSLNVSVCQHFPEIIEAGNALGWEWFSHGTYNTRDLAGMSPEQERRLIRDSIDTIREFTGQKLSGWLGPQLSVTNTIFDSLAAEGVEYTLDLFHDDQPTPLNVSAGRLISVPYSWVVNDGPMFHMWSISPGDYCDILKRQFDRLYAEGGDNPTVMGVPLHPYLVGQPNRIGALDEFLGYATGHEGVWLPTAREISAWYYEHHYDTVVEAQRNLGAYRHAGA